MKKWIGFLAVIVLIVLLLPREKPQNFVTNLNQHPEMGTGNIRVLDVTSQSSGVQKVHVEFEMKEGGRSSWIQDIEQMDHNPELSIHKYQGMIYLEHNGLYSWRIVQK